MKPLVKIVWRDVCANSLRWFDDDEALEWAIKMWEQEHITVGYLLYKDAKFVTVASSKDAEGQYNDLSMIPRSLVKKITRLE